MFIAGGNRTGRLEARNRLLAGINCLDADVICAHIVFGEFRQQVGGELRLGRNPVKTCPCSCTAGCITG